MPFRRIHKAVTWLMAIQGLGLLAMSGKLGVPGSIAAGASLVGAWFLDEEKPRHRWWTTAWNAATVAAFLVQFVRWMSGEDLPTVAVQYAAFLQVNKLWNRRNQADHDQIAMLSLLHLIGSAILFTDLTYALVFVLYAVTTPWMLVLGQIRREVEAKYMDRGDGRSVRDMERVLNSKRIVSGRFLAAMAGLSIPIYLVTAILFVTFPRIGIGLLAGSDPSQRNLTGFSDQVVIGDLAPMFDDPTVVLRAEFPGGRPADEEIAALYWRGSSYDRFDGREWHRTLGHGQTVRSAGGRYLVSAAAASGANAGTAGLLGIDVFLQPLYPKVVFLPQETALVVVPSPEPLRVMAHKLRWGPGDEVRYGDPGGAGIHYRLWMDPGFAQMSKVEPYMGGAAGTAGEGEALDPWLEMPATSPEFDELARGFATAEPDPRRRALAIEKWLRTSFAYTKAASEEVPDGTGPVDAFLFGWRKGNCEYFSTALALLLRATGIPSRNVTGFVGGEWNDVGDYLAVREADAHSWVEARFEGSGWLLMDPTPPAEGPGEEGRSAFAVLGDLVDSMRLSWHKHIIAYDLGQQAQIARRGYEGFASLRAALKGMEAPAAGDEGRSAQRKALVLLAMVAMFLAYHATRTRGMAGAARGPGARKGAPDRKALDLIGLLDRRLEELGLRRPASRPPYTHSRIVGREVADPGALEEIVSVYNASRFGGQAVAADKFKALRGRIDVLGRKPPEKPAHAPSV